MAQELVQKTKNYDLFKFLEHNRNINPSVDLRESMIRNGFLRARPALVRAIPGSKSFHILDGQNRITLAKELGLDVYYTINNEVTDDLLADLQTGKSWIPKDYLKSYYVQGKPGYAIMKVISEKYPRVKPTVIINLLTGYAGIAEGGSKGTDAFRRGKLKVTNEAEAKVILEYCADLYTKYNAKWVWTRAFILALATIHKTGRYDHKRMITKLEWLSEKFVKLNSPIAYFERLREIYNFKSRKENIENFESIKK